MRLGHRIDTAELDGLSNQVRIERLSARLAADGPMPVHRAVARRGGCRLILHLDDRSVLTQRLFWARTADVDALCSIEWNDDVGWISVVRTTGGERRVDYAWLAKLTPGSA